MLPIVPYSRLCRIAAKAHILGEEGRVTRRCGADAAAARRTHLR